MSKLDKTFELLKSLNKSEKRFFKIYSGRHVIGDQNKYVQLFDAMDKQTVYNEEQIKENFKDYKFVNRMPVAKAYLYDLMLKSMSAYHNHHSIEAQLYDNLKQIRFLYNKKLYQQAEILLDKTLKLSKDQDYLELMPEIMRWKKKLMDLNNYAITHQELKQLCFDEVDQIDQLELVNKFWKLQATLLISTNETSLSSDAIKAMEDVFNERFMQLPDKQLPFRARFLKNKIYATYFYQINDIQSSYNYLKEMMHLLDSVNYKTEFYYNEYIETIHRLLNTASNLHLQKEHQFYVDRLSELFTSKNDFKSGHIKTKISEIYEYHLTQKSNKKESKQPAMEKMAAA